MKLYHMKSGVATLDGTSVAVTMRAFDNNQNITFMPYRSESDMASRLSLPRSQPTVSRLTTSVMV
jgi:hypothetical protein